MKLSYRPYKLKFKHPFGVSSNIRTHTPTVFLKLDLGGICGYGEACIPSYLGETEEQTISFFEKAQTLLNGVNVNFVLDEVLANIDALAPGCNAAKAACDVALHDVHGKILGKSISQLYNLPASENIYTSCTIGLDYADKIAQKIKEASDFKILKIKAGSENDKALINMVRAYTDKPLYIDVNQGWKDQYFVLDMLHFMHEHNVLLAEQPMPADMIDEMAWVTERSPIPTIADESVKRLQDIDRIRFAFSGINIKLMKCTGISEALKMIDMARKNNLKVMLGCMAESSCASTAMAHLAALADYIDLDAPFLHPDGVTLYFSSKGHNSMGEYDVFKSVLNEENNRFSPAENLGYPINTVDNDIFFVTNVDGRRAWYSSVKDETFGDNDIYEIDTRFGDNDLIVKHGTAFKENEPAKLKITLLDNEGNQVNGTYFSNPRTGKFILVMNPLKSYRAIVEADGYTTVVHEINPPAFEKEDKDFEFRLKKSESK